MNGKILFAIVLLVATALAVIFGSNIDALRCAFVGDKASYSLCAAENRFFGQYTKARTAVIGLIAFLALLYVSFALFTNAIDAYEIKPQTGLALFVLSLAAFAAMVGTLYYTPLACLNSGESDSSTGSGSYSECMHGKLFNF